MVTGDTGSDEKLFFQFNFYMCLIGAKSNKGYYDNRQ